MPVSEDGGVAESTPSRTPEPDKTAVGRAISETRETVWSLPVIVATVAASVLVTFVRLVEAYDEFLVEALLTWATLALFLLNALLTLAIVAILVPIISPRNKILYAVTIALSFQTLVTTDLTLGDPLAGTNATTEARPVNLNVQRDFYGPVQTLLSRRIDAPVEAAIREETEGMLKKFPDRRALGVLPRRVDALLQFERSLTQEEKDAMRREVRAALRPGLERPKDRSRPGPAVRRAVREATAAMYRHDGRELVRELGGVSA